jgi:hypothetical protein
MTAPVFWHIDVRIAGEWKPTAGHERTRDDAIGRADAVYRWAAVRVREVISGETWHREAGRGWVKGEPMAAAPPPANPRSPMRAPENAAKPEGDYWWNKGGMK